MSKPIYEYDLHKYYKLKIKKDIYINNGLCGLMNIGNKCFMNSILQCLNNTISLTDYFLSCDYKQDATVQNKRLPERFLLISYITIINHMWDKNHVIKPKSFVENLSKFHPIYFSLEQQDSHECLLFILDILHKSLAYQIDVSITSKHPYMELFKNTWDTFFEKSYSVIIKTFYGCTISEIKCDNCKCIETIFEPFNTLNIDVYDDLNTSLSNYFNNEEINKRICEKCKNNGCVKKNKLWEIPDYLILHLKRFNNNGTKNNTHVKYPITDLDITPYVHDINSDNYIYDLYAINHHSGDLSGGHYWSSVKKLDNKWYIFDDANVHKIQNPDTSNSYILFYQRKKIPTQKIIQL